MDEAVHHEVQITGKTDIGDDLTSEITNCDVAVDFSFHEATRSLAELAVAHGKSLVIGTTGHSEEDRTAITQLASQIPIVWAGNFSIGVNLLFYLTSKAASILSPDYNPEIVEMHHCLKKDAPSGTASRLAEIIRQARQLTPNHERHGRKGITGERPREEIGIHALRGGEVVGDHTVIFAGPGERLELSHKAADRRIFAQGALKAAKWVSMQAPGLYSMQDYLGLT